MSTRMTRIAFLERTAWSVGLGGGLLATALLQVTRLGPASPAAEAIVLMTLLGPIGAQCLITGRHDRPTRPGQTPFRWLYEAVLAAGVGTIYGVVSSVPVLFLLVVTAQGTFAGEAGVLFWNTSAVGALILPGLRYWRLPA